MFGDINEIRLMGNVTSDVECKYTPSGTPVLTFSIATNRSYKKNDEYVDEVTYHNVVAWRNAESLAKRIVKGTRIYIEGRLTIRSWEKNGERRYRAEIITERPILIDRYIKPEGQQDTPNKPRQDDLPGEYIGNEAVEEAFDEH
jgi:single-strand DNA-binding protein